MIGRIIIGLLLASMWCLLLEEFTVLAFLTGFALAAAVLALFRGIGRQPARWSRGLWRPRKLWLLLKLAARFSVAVVVSNLQVARLVLSPRLRVQPAWVRVPITLRTDWAITTLASLISLTPGSVTVDVAEDRQSLLIHCLNEPSAASIVCDIKKRFEAPLVELEQ